MFSLLFQNVHEYFLKIFLCARGSPLIFGAALYLGLYSSVEVYVIGVWTSCLSKYS